MLELKCYGQFHDFSFADMKTCFREFVQNSVHIGQKYCNTLIDGYYQFSSFWFTKLTKTEIFNNPCFVVTGSFHPCVNLDINSGMGEIQKRPSSKYVEMKFVSLLF